VIISLERFLIELRININDNLNIFSFNPLRCLSKIVREASSFKANNTLDIVINPNDVISTDLKLKQRDIQMSKNSQLKIRLLKI